MMIMMMIMMLVVLLLVIAVVFGFRSSLTLCFLLDFLISIDTICMGLPTVYFKGSQVEFSELCCISAPEGCFNISKQHYAAFHLGLHCLQKYSFRGFPNTKG